MSPAGAVPRFTIVPIAPSYACIWAVTASILATWSVSPIASSPARAEARSLVIVTLALSNVLVRGIVSWANTAATTWVALNRM